MLWWKPGRFLTSFFKSVMHQSSVAWNTTPLHFYSSNIIYFSQKKPIETNFLDFRVLELKFVRYLMSMLQGQGNSSSIFVSLFIVMTHNSSVNFELVHFLIWTKGSHRSCRIPHAIFQTTSQFFFKFCITLQCHER